MKKFCKDCKWCEPLTSISDIKDQIAFSRCDCPKNFIYCTDLVSGIKSMKYDQYFCNVQRSSKWLDAILLGRCGKRGRWYERSNL